MEVQNMPIKTEEIKWDDPVSEKVNTKGISWDSDRPMKYVSEMVGTIKRLAEVVPAFETAANIATSTYGIPISGLVGLAALPFGVQNSKNAIDAVQKFMVYQPQTEGGKQLTEAATLPMQKLDEFGRSVSDKIENPIVGAITNAVIDAAPALIGAGRTSPKVGGGQLGVVEHGINKGVRPPITKKEVLSQRNRYMENANIAVDEIINNKNNLKLMDRDGNTVAGELPKSLDQFSQAISQTKNDIFKEYDSLSKSADSRGASVNMGPIISELRAITSDRVLETLSPETISYANSRMAALTEAPIKDSPFRAPKSFSTQEAQTMVKMLNQSEKAYYANPTPELKGKAYIDGLIANNLRAGLDAAVEDATGIEYQPLKLKYGALRMLETDVTKRSIVDARKNIKGLIDFSDIFSSSQVVQGLIAQQPALLASGMTVKAFSGFIKSMNDPNKIISKMFEKSEKNRNINYVEKPPITHGFAFSAVAGEQQND